MQLFNGFLQGIGIIWGFIFAIVIFVIIMKKIKKRNPSNVKVKEWKGYLADVIANDDFAEAKFVTDLIANKKDSDEIKTPSGYTVKVKSELILDDEKNDGPTVFRTRKTYIITKIKK